MTEDELLAEIQKVDPDARIIDKGGFRVISTTSIESRTIAFINPANMHIFPFDFDWHGEDLDG